MITFILAVCGNVDYVYSFPQSPPSRAAWIEIIAGILASNKLTSPPSRAAWIEITAILSAVLYTLSPPSRAAWIEILPSHSKGIGLRVAAFTGGVD